MEKGYDAGKKVSGIKRHIAVDTQGLPHALAVTTADVTDRKGCLLALKRELDNLGAVQKILADGGYTGKAFASSVQELMVSKSTKFNTCLSVNGCLSSEN
ncbi:Mobile element protein [Cardiobacterium hominis]|uniref:Mobile element protein n=1 Tax=Cardiobacterium hominis TaxID=2718 RepID=A0A1C3H5A3_9GAMM|nr:Mobile element protein [Cardiobacterium hominis]